MARARSARGGGVYSVAGPQWQDLRQIVDLHMPSTEALRRLVPVLLIGFAVIAIAGFSYQIANGKTAALASAQRQLALMPTSPP